jgi:hypothetical protein
VSALRTTTAAAAAAAPQDANGPRTIGDLIKAQMK